MFDGQPAFEAGRFCSPACQMEVEVGEGYIPDASEEEVCFEEEPESSSDAESQEGTVRAGAGNRHWPGRARSLNK